MVTIETFGERGRHVSSWQVLLLSFYIFLLKIVHNVDNFIVSGKLIEVVGVSQGS